MKKNRRKKDMATQRSSQANDEPVMINYKEQLKSQNPEVRDAALQLLRQADSVTVVDSKKPRGLLIIADKVKVQSDGTQIIVMEGNNNVVVQVDDEQSDDLVDESAQQIEELHTLLEKVKGPWKFFGEVQDLDDPDHEPRFMFTWDGAITEINTGDRRGPVFAYTRQMAEQYVGAMKETYGVKLSVADVQAVDRQLFGSLLARASMSGANCYFVINPADHGNATITSVPLEVTFHVLDGWIVPTTDTELPQYIVVDDGCIRCREGGEYKGPILAHSREVAERFAAENEKAWGGKLSVEKIKIPVDALLNMLVEDWANCASVIRSVADDGETKWDLIYPVNPPTE